MPPIVRAGTLPLPVRYESWCAWRAETADALPPAPLIAPHTSSCPYCWGQRRVWEEAPNGEGLVPRVCECCLGTGLVRTKPARGRTAR
ncbi:MAG: hypothetical protein QOK40_962 [Miltoncostaeaceae bacterium]|jgi:hypothetical protein|nr:hypothetical protein [Miltoncostaeaceae bacterium]